MVLCHDPWPHRSPILYSLDVIAFTTCYYSFAFVILYAAHYQQFTTEINYNVWSMIGVLLGTSAMLTSIFAILVFTWCRRRPKSQTNDVCIAPSKMDATSKNVLSQDEGHWHQSNRFRDGVFVMPASDLRNQSSVYAASIPRHDDVSFKVFFKEPLTELNHNHKEKVPPYVILTEGDAPPAYTSSQEK